MTVYRDTTAELCKTQNDLAYTLGRGSWSMLENFAWKALNDRNGSES